MEDGLSRVNELSWRLCKVTGQDFFFVSIVLLSTIILLILISSSVSLSYFNLAVPTRKCLGKHSCMNSPFSIAILITEWNLFSSGTNTLLWWRWDFETDCREWRTWRLYMVTGQDFFLSCPRYFFPHLFSSSYLLPLFHCLISILLFPCAGVWENTRAWVPHFL